MAPWGKNVGFTPLSRPTKRNEPRKEPGTKDIVVNVPGLTHNFPEPLLLEGKTSRNDIP